MSYVISSPRVIVGDQFQVNGDRVAFNNDKGFAGMTTGFAQVNVAKVGTDNFVHYGQYTGALGCLFKAPFVTDAFQFKGNGAQFAILDSSGLRLSDTNRIKSGKQVAKAYLKYDHLAPGGDNNSRYNIASVSEDSAGQFTVNFTTAMADTDFIVNATADLGFCSVGLKTVSSVILYTYNVSGVLENKVFHLSVHGSQTA